MNEQLFIEHKDELKNYTFWSTTRIDFYDITTYDETLCKQGPISKQTAHDFLARDINYVLNNINDKDVLLRTTVLQTQLKDCRRNDTNKMFWNQLGPRIVALHYTKPIAEQELAVAGLSNAAELINPTSKRNSDSLDVELPPKKQQKQKARETTETEPVEHDNLFVGGATVSVGTIITEGSPIIQRKQAESSECTRKKDDVFKIYISNGVFKYNDSNGLSSILDLVDSSDLSQKSLFTQETWEELKETLKSERGIDVVAVPSGLANTWTIAVSSIKTTMNIPFGINYIYKILPKQTTEARRYMKIFEHILEIVDTYPHMLSKNPPTGCAFSESDVLRIIWSPTGETISVVSQENKEDLYGTNTSIKAFKIDIRVIYNRGKKQVDIVSGELAKNDEDLKIVTDEGKLNRETKDAVDSIISIIGKPLHTFGLQLSGSTCMVSCQALARNGLYAFTPLFSFSLPTCINDLDSFGSTFQKLYSFQHHVLNIAADLKKETDMKLSIMKSFGERPASHSSASSVLEWRRDTFYTPPQNKQAKVPKHLFGTPSNVFLSRLMEAKNSENTSGVIYDEYGWGRQGETEWHNKYSGEVTNEPPYQD
ncbi:hypothetical protein MBANPS3_009249 [Mucor bainieri]